MPQDLEMFPVFASLQPEQRRALAEISGTNRYPAGHLLFQENDPGDGFYGILEGKVKIFKTSLQGKEHILHIFGPGETFAEAAVFAGRNFPANALSLEESRLIFFPRDAFRSLLFRDPDLVMNLLGQLSQKLRYMVSKVEELSLKEAPARLAVHLLLLRENLGRDEFQLDLNKSQLAGFLGTIPETLSRVIRKMSQEGYIQIKGNQVLLLDVEGLDELAGGMVRL